MNSAGKPESWKYQGGSWAVACFIKEADGGNKILEWAGDVATTRKQVAANERKSGIQISYKHPDKGWVNEQFISTVVSDLIWGQDSSWQTIAIQKDVENQIAEVSNDLTIKIDGLTEAVASSDFIGVFKNGFINKFGNIQALTGDSNIYTKEYIPIPEGKTEIQYEGKTQQNAASVCFYDEEKVFISYIQGSSQTISIPENAKYYRACSLNGILKIDGKELNATKISDIEKRVEALENNESSFENDMNVLKKEALGDSYYQVVSEKYLNRYGSITTAVGQTGYLCIEEYIPISEDESEIQYEGNAGSNGACICFYDEEKTFISSVQGGKQTVQIPEGAKYYRAGSLNGTLKLNGRVPDESRVDSNEIRITNLENSQSIKEGEIICAGDSLTVGANGATNSYPQQLQERFPQCTIINRGNNGWRASGLLPELCNMADKQNYYGAPSTVTDYTNVIAVIINMGTNGGVSGSIEDIPSIDKATNSEGESLGYINVNAALDGTLYYDSNQINSEEAYWNLFADTWYGNVAISIEYILWKNPKVQIFLVNPAVSSISDTNNSGSVKIAEAMQELAEMYGIIFIDMRKIGVNRRNQNLFLVDYVHGNNLRNEIYGKYIANMISQYLKV